ncbi:MAG: YciI family protein [Candidatus Acidiferrum sp.]
MSPSKAESRKSPTVRSPEAKEVVGGYWIIQVKSREEALEWASRIPGQDNETVEVRRMFEIRDFDPDTQTEIQRKFGDIDAAPGRL